MIRPCTRITYMCTIHRLGRDRYRSPVPVAHGASARAHRATSSFLCLVASFSQHMRTTCNGPPLRLLRGAGLIFLLLLNRRPYPPPQTRGRLFSINSSADASIAPLLTSITSAWFDEDEGGSTLLGSTCVPAAALLLLVAPR